MVGWKIKVLMCSLLYMIANPSFACSNIFIHGNGFSAVARSLDWYPIIEFKGGIAFSQEDSRAEYPLSNETFTSNPAEWTNRHTSIGSLYPAKDVDAQVKHFIDGVNDAGVYAGYNGFSGTEYPEFDKESSKPAIGVWQVVDYILGTSSSVEDALNNLNTVQVINDPRFPLNAMGLHLIIRDKYGKSAVVEWVNGRANIYEFPHDMDMITNAPSLPDQLENQSKYNDLSINEMLTNENIIPADFSSVSRFTRGHQLIRVSPTPKSEDDALGIAMGIMQSVQFPLTVDMNADVSSSPEAKNLSSYWESLSDLKNNIYYIFQRVSEDRGDEVKANPAKSIKTYDLSEYAQSHQRPEGFVDINANY